MHSNTDLPSTYVFIFNNIQNQGVHIQLHSQKLKYKCIIPVLCTAKPLYIMLKNYKVKFKLLLPSNEFEEVQVNFESNLSKEVFLDMPTLTLPSLVPIKSKEAALGS